LEKTKLGTEVKVEEFIKHGIKLADGAEYFKKNIYKKIKLKYLIKILKDIENSSTKK